MNKISTVEAAKSIRKNWGELCPVTKRIESKKLYTRKVKHKLQEV